LSENIMRILKFLTLVMTVLLIGSTVYAQVPVFRIEMALTTLPLEGAAPAVTGPYAVTSERAFQSHGHELIRPSDLAAFPRQDTLPVLVWGNGGCNLDAKNYHNFLMTIASHGFLVVTTAVVEGEPQRMADAGDLRAAIDWVMDENARAGSPLAGRIDTTHVAVMGQSCGGILAIILGADPRVATTGVFNTGVMPAPIAAFQETPPAVTEDDLPSLRGPVLFINGHKRDVMMPYSLANFEEIRHVPAFYGSRHDAGHMATMTQPGGGEFANVAANWLRYYFKGDQQAGKMFVGKDCALCTNPHWDTASKGMQ
jgi:hypothetical protein